MGGSKIIEDLSKYLNEVLGYLLPGFTFSLLAMIFIDPKQFPNISLSFKDDVILLLLVSYVLGYLVYGMGLWRDSLLKFIMGKTKKNYQILVESIIDKLKVKSEFIAAANLIERNIPNFDKSDFNSVRNQCMSHVPEADQKIYTFMFRAELSNHVGLVFIIFGIWLTFSLLAHNILNNTLLLNALAWKYFYLPILFYITSYFFHLTRKRFLTIAYKIVFSIFIAKYKGIK